MQNVLHTLKVYHHAMLEPGNLVSPRLHALGGKDPKALKTFEVSRAVPETPALNPHPTPSTQNRSPRPYTLKLKPYNASVREAKKVGMKDMNRVRPILAALSAAGFCRLGSASSGVFSYRNHVKAFKGFFLLGEGGWGGGYLSPRMSHCSGVM